MITHFPRQNVISRMPLIQERPGALYAYGLCRLNAFSSKCIKVRRSSDNTTTDIGFVQNGLDTPSLLSFCSGTDGFIDTWYDQSGNGYDLTQATTTRQPKIVTSGSMTFTSNGNLFAVFDGTDDYMDNTSCACPTTEVFLAIGLYKNDQTATINQLYTSGGSAFVGHQTLANEAYYYASSGNYGKYAYTNTTDDFTNTSFFNGTLIGNSERLKVWLGSVKNTLSFTGTIPTTVSGTGISLGRPYGVAAAYAKGKISYSIGWPVNYSDPVINVIPFIT